MNVTFEPILPAEKKDLMTLNRLVTSFFFLFSVEFLLGFNENAFAFTSFG